MDFDLRGLFTCGEYERKQHTKYTELTFLHEK